MKLNQRQGSGPTTDKQVHRGVSPAVNHLSDGTLLVVNRMVAGAVELHPAMQRRNLLRSGRSVIRATNRTIFSQCAPKVVHHLKLKSPVASSFNPSFKTTWSGSVSLLPAAPWNISFKCFQIPEHPSTPSRLAYINVTSRTFRYLLTAPKP